MSSYEPTNNYQTTAMGQIVPLLVDISEEKKAKGVNPDSKSGVEPQQRLNGILVTFRQLLHAGTPPVKLTLVSPLDPAHRDERVRLTLHKSPSL